MLVFWLIALLPVAAVVYILWAHRKKTAEQAAASGERFEKIFGNVAKEKRAATPATVTNARGAASVTQAATGRLQPYARKERMLGEMEALLFHELTAALPEYEIFIRVSLASLLEVPAVVQGREREPRLRALHQHVLDCLVCDRELRPVAAVDIESGSSAESAFKVECLKAADVRYLRFDPAALPRGNALRALLLGETA